MPTGSAEFALADETATARLGAALARAIERLQSAIVSQGLIVGLVGDLGARPAVPVARQTARVPSNTDPR